MPPFTQPTFQERTQMAAKAKQAALKKLKAKKPLSPEVIAERKAAELAREEKQAKASEEKRAAFEQEKAERKAAKEAAKPKLALGLTETEKKAARDERYAARKKRKR
ncbi:MAG: hypothetical protein GW808_02665 [Sphingomonadales bacterium]|nr:hypothetical protein [Sphingomonadales bacterium]PIX66668.1 MAG: hypothetical protein COZ43_05225 [Sphingomonadales bacterium CG_4_10_14_3_um_filter_58_15]NCO48486.1 hypothetical protein [Sphingomonadales bacterium]NCO99302.1 hypothetical protein [Sphingomonadales bacterium]NCP27861.1 hypothetical protein [Sphingomonadales bacterium]